MSDKDEPEVFDRVMVPLVELYRMRRDVALYEDELRQAYENATAHWAQITQLRADLIHARREANACYKAVMDNDVYCLMNGDNASDGWSLGDEVSS